MREATSGKWMRKAEDGSMWRSLGEVFVQLFINTRQNEDDDDNVTYLSMCKAPAPFANYVPNL